MKDRLSRWLPRLALLTVLAGVVSTFLVNPDEAEARKRKGQGSRITEGMDKRGNDFVGVSHHLGSKRANMYANRHFGVEELLYGPGDQSNIWNRPRGERLNDRSGGMRGGGGGGRRGYSESYEEYGYSDSCDGGY